MLNLPILTSHTILFFLLFVHICFEVFPERDYSCNMDICIYLKPYLNLNTSCICIIAISTQITTNLYMHLTFLHDSLHLTWVKNWLSHYPILSDKPSLHKYHVKIYNEETYLIVFCFFPKKFEGYWMLPKCRVD